MNWFMYLFEIIDEYVQTHLINVYVDDDEN